MEKIKIKFTTILSLSLIVLLSTLLFHLFYPLTGMHKYLADFLWLDIAGGIIFFSNQHIRDYAALTLGRKWNRLIIPLHIVQLSIAWIYFDQFSFTRAVLAFFFLLSISLLMMYAYTELLPPLVAATLLFVLLFTSLFEVKNLPWFPAIFVTKLLWFYLAGTTQTYRNKNNFR